MDKRKLYELILEYGNCRAEKECELYSGYLPDTAKFDDLIETKLKEIKKMLEI